MTTKQYTIRRVHPVIDQELRRMAQASNRSLNEVMLNVMMVGLGLHSYDLQESPRPLLFKFDRLKLSPESQRMQGILKGRNIPATKQAQRKAYHERHLT